MIAPPKNTRTDDPSEVLARADIDAILGGSHHDPFAVLGVHAVGDTFVARCFIPSAVSVTAETLTGKEIGELTQLDPAGIFAGPLSIRKQQPVRYRAKNDGGEWIVVDPYSFGPVMGPMDDYYIREGSHLRLFEKMGAHPHQQDGIDGFHFAVWAPNAQRVSIVGNFNAWDGRRHVMRLRRDTGIWEIFLPGITEGHAYKYEIVGKDGELLPLKADPFARRSELRPNTASMTTGQIAQICAI